jgi:hypothetical protein
LEVSSGNAGRPLAKAQINTLLSPALFIVRPYLTSLCPTVFRIILAGRRWRRWFSRTVVVDNALLEVTFWIIRVLFTEWNQLEVQNISFRYLYGLSIDVYDCCK